MIVRSVINISLIIKILWYSWFSWFKGHASIKEFILVCLFMYQTFKMYYALIAVSPLLLYLVIYINLMGKIALIISYAYCKNSIWSELYLTEIDHKLKKTAAYRRASLYGLNREFYSHNLPPPQIPPNVEIINYTNALQVGIIKCLYLIIKFLKSREDFVTATV